MFASRLAFRARQPSLSAVMNSAQSPVHVGADVLWGVKTYTANVTVSGGTPPYTNSRVENQGGGLLQAVSISAAGTSNVTYTPAAGMTGVRLKLVDSTGANVVSNTVAVTTQTLWMNATSAFAYVNGTTPVPAGQTREIAASFGSPNNSASDGGTWLWEYQSHFGVGGAATTWTTFSPGSTTTATTGAFLAGDVYDFRFTYNNGAGSVTGYLMNVATE